MARAVDSWAKSHKQRKRGPKLSDGSGLYLAAGEGRCSWIYLYTWRSKPRSLGLGAYPRVGLAQARQARDRAEGLLLTGIDPSEDAKPNRCSFGEAALALIAAKESGWRNAVHRAQWRSTLETYCASMWSMPVAEVETEDALSVLQPIWQAKAETASRLRGRIEAVLDYAKAHGMCSGENPARWRGHLDKLLPKRQKLTRGHHAAMPYRDVPEFMDQLRKREAIASLALEFLILTAARSGEALGARWNEIDFEAKIWTVPAGRMKAGREHRVPLSGRALEILKQLFEVRTGDCVFLGQQLDRPLSPTALAMLMRRMGHGDITVHGFRSAFREWCGDQTNFAREIAEAALAHVAGDATERA